MHRGHGFGGYEMASGVEFRQRLKATRKVEAATNMLWVGLVATVVGFTVLGVAIWRSPLSSGDEAQAAPPSERPRKAKVAAVQAAPKTPYELCMIAARQLGPPDDIARSNEIERCRMKFGMD